jgi:membrane protease YdiL (CAAX protease family)
MKKAMGWQKLIKNQKTKTIVIIIFFVLLLVLNLISSFSLQHKEMNTYSISRILLTIFIIIILNYMGYDKLIKKSKTKNIVLLIIPAIVISIHNFPISAWIFGRVSLDLLPISLILFLIECFSISLFEEIVFRGILLGILLIHFKTYQFGVLKSIILSSTIFGLTHLFNIFSGMSLTDVLLQVLYTTLISIVWAIIYIRTKNIWIIILLHTLFNFFGYVVIEFGSVQNRYDIYTIISTLIIIILSGLFYFNEYKRIHNEEINLF